MHLIVILVVISTVFQGGEAETEAKCLMSGRSVSGVIRLIELNDRSMVLGVNLADFVVGGINSHRLVVHQNGDTSNSCSNVGARVTGYIGSIKEDDLGRVREISYPSQIALTGNNGIMGKTLVIYEGTNVITESPTILGCCKIEPVSQADIEVSECQFQSMNPGQNVQGRVIASQLTPGGMVRFDYDVTGFRTNDGISEHGFHIHENGDLGNNCNGAGSHFNPEYKFHGGPNMQNRHVGDLGNIIEDNTGRALDTKYDVFASLIGPRGIVGRTIAVHVRRDDLLTQSDGNAGARLACCIFPTPSRLSQLSGATRIANINYIHLLLILALIAYLF